MSFIFISDIATSYFYPRLSKQHFDFYFCLKCDECVPENRMIMNTNYIFKTFFSDHYTIVLLFKLSILY